MDHKTCGSIIVVPGADGIDHRSQSEERGQHQALHNVVAEVVQACSRTAVVALMTYSFAVTAWHAHREPGGLAFIASAYAALAGLLLCLRRAERLRPDSPAAERQRLRAAVWALSAALSCALAYRVSVLMSAALVFVIWCMTSFLVLVGFYVLVLCRDQQYQISVDVVERDAAGDGKPLIKKITPSDEMA